MGRLAEAGSLRPGQRRGVRRRRRKEVDSPPASLAWSKSFILPFTPSPNRPTMSSTVPTVIGKLTQNNGLDRPTSWLMSPPPISYLRPPALGPPSCAHRPSALAPSPSRLPAVVGAGCIGLTTAIEVLKQGHHVLVVADHLPSDPLSAEYASSAAGAHHLSFAA